MKKLLISFAAFALLCACESTENEFAEKQRAIKQTPAEQAAADTGCKYKSEQFEDLSILRYEVKGFDQLSLKTKTLLYYLYEAALSGRDIIYDQNYKYNLVVRKTLEAIIANYKGEQDNSDFQGLLVYAKRVWFSNGIHHHY